MHSLVLFYREVNKQDDTLHYPQMKVAHMGRSGQSGARWSEWVAVVRVGRSGQSGSRWSEWVAVVRVGRGGQSGSRWSSGFKTTSAVEKPRQFRSPHFAHVFQKRH